jgi:peptidoglycan/LPS O-acetylase OafA/YrhL
MVMQALMHRTPLSVAILLAVGASLAASCLTYRFVETPSQRLARRLSQGPPSVGRSLVGWVRSARGA